MKLANAKIFIRSFRLAAWLGWQIESNWADPFLFAIYSIVKPLASAAILVVMYSVITDSNFEAPIFSYIYLGNAFYIFVGQVMTGISWAVIDDREHYKTLKYIYVTPVQFSVYLMGRGVARFIIAAFSVLITILFGVLFLNVHIEFSQVNWMLFILTLIIGVVMLAMMGLILAGVMMQLVHHEFGIGDAIASALYLFSGAVFPLEVLPSALRWVGFINPVTYWLELLRRALVGQVAQAFPTLSSLSDLQILGVLLGLTLIFTLCSGFIFSWCENRAREQGLIDVVTNY